MANNNYIVPSKEQLIEYSLKIKKFIKMVEPYSYEEYLCYALQMALLAAKEGNYGIGAVIVLRSETVEYIIGGRNQIFSKKDSSLHAERDALHKLEAICQNHELFSQAKNAGKISSQDILFKRPAPKSDKKVILVSTLEPCAGCYQEILIHNTFGVKIDYIFGAGEHPDSGSVHPFRREHLPPIWQRMTEEQHITILTSWHHELYSLSLEIFTLLPSLHKRYYKKNQHDSATLFANLKRLKDS